MYASPPPTPTPISTTLDADIKELKRDNLSIKNEITRMQNQSEWRSEVRSQGQASITNFVGQNRGMGRERKPEKR
ncbi:18839_t:CDS:2 [Dentiscutata erythropus]|uniref:18839_t:CDS:1 n=1 Tax=Dentiscutata erythropus TaxID=1348616 RepID=A0A9N9EF07_9GLOM|nr:18839_t:CDS:2 [Dentiscutata erythropus]